MVTKRNLGLIAFANDGGLGAQTRRLAHFLKPERIMIIDSSGFSTNKEQHFEWYKDYPHFIVHGFPNNDEVKKFLQNLTHVFTVENPYNFGIVHWGQEQGIKIYCQSNYEFCENLAQPWLPTPDKFLMPSYWQLAEMEEIFGKDCVEHLPPPMDMAEFDKARTVNMKRRGKRGKCRFLHIIGTAATADRNGTLDLIDSIPKCKEDFELVIRSQHNLSMDVFLDDPRVTYEIGNSTENSSLFTNFDALLLPRRWGGLCLPMNEALASGLPVLMSDISPNDRILPKEWLTEASYKGKFMARTLIDYHSVDHEKYAAKIDWIAKMSIRDLMIHKHQAISCANSNFSNEALKERYSLLFTSFFTSF